MVQVATQQLNREFSETILVISTMDWIGLEDCPEEPMVFQCGAALKWWVFNVLDDDDDDGKHVCDLDLTTGEFDELLRFINMNDNKKRMTILHSASLWSPALFRLQAKVAAVWRVPTCSVQLVSMAKDQRLGVYKRLVDIKTMDMRLERHIRPKDIEKALPHWSMVQATWFPVHLDGWLNGRVVEWYRVWRLSICFERYREKGPLPATVIIEVRSYDPDPDTGEFVVFETHSQDFARHDKADSSVELLSVGTLEFGPFDLEDYMGFDNKRNNNLGFSLRIQIVEELRDDGA